MLSLNKLLPKLQCSLSEGSGNGDVNEGWIQESTRKMNSLTFGQPNIQRGRRSSPSPLGILGKWQGCSSGVARGGFRGGSRGGRIWEDREFSLHMCRRYLLEACSRKKIGPRVSSKANVTLTITPSVMYTSVRQRPRKAKSPKSVNSNNRASFASFVRC